VEHQFTWLARRNRSLDEGAATYHTLQVDETKPLAYVIADDDQVWSEESPALGAGSVVKLKTILSFAGADLKDKGLVQVPEQGDGSFAVEALTTLANPPARGQQDGRTRPSREPLRILTIEKSISRISRPLAAGS
jgi:hypothetical protein